MGGIVIELSRSGTGTGDGHVSERPLPRDLVNVTLRNDGAPEELVAAALQTLAAHGLNRVCMDPPAHFDDLLAADSHVAPQLHGVG